MRMVQLSADTAATAGTADAVRPAPVRSGRGR